MLGVVIAVLGYRNNPWDRVEVKVRWRMYP